MVFAYAAIGLLSSVIGVATARIGKNGDPGKALNSSTYVTTAILPYLRLCQPTSLTRMAYLGATAIGLIVGTIIGLTSDYFTNDAKPPVRAVANASKSGPALPYFQVFPTDC